MRSQVVGVHTAARQQRWKMVYLNLVVVRVSRNPRFSWKKMCMEYSRTKHWVIVLRKDVYVKRGMFILPYSYHSALHCTQEISISPFNYCPVCSFVM